MKLWAENLIKEYSSRRVVNGVNLELSDKEIVGLLGPNGAGKTTIFHMLIGLVRPLEGKIYLEEREITHLPTYQKAKRGIGYLPQEPSIFRGLTVEENILAVLETLPLTRQERKRRLSLLLEEFGLTHLAKQKAFLLSGGERRRCEIARSLVIEPKILLLDEPFTGIDPITVSEIQDIIAFLKKRGIGILITDHNVRDTLKITARAYLIHQGRILFQGSAEELLANQEARKLYFGEKFQL
jgi:lipopolysaccharide export system ATP-binding protein